MFSQLSVRPPGGYPLWTDTPPPLWTETPPGQRPPWTEASWTEIPLWTETPPPLWTETSP